MESEKINDYLSMEHVDHSKDKLQQIKLTGKVTFIGHFFNADQQEDMKKDNKWVLRHASGDLITVKGEDIISIG